VSRGIGKVQREALAALWDRAKSEGIAGGMPLAELKRSISSDRSNARRAIRGLVERGLVEEVAGEGGERRAKLTGGAHLALWLASYPEDAPLALERVPSRPLVLDLGDDLGIAEEDTLGLDNLMSLGIPHEPSPPPLDRGVSDLPPSSRGHGDAMPMGMSHANAPLPPDRPISDNVARTPGRGDPMQAGTPHVSLPPPPDRGVSDNGPNSARAEAMQMRGSHANAAASPDPAVSDNGERSGSTVLEMIAKMAQERLARLDEEAG
jgi:hypothetical protein